MKSIQVKMDWIGDGAKTETFATNNNGDGLFLPNGVVYNQLAGNGNFHADTPKAMMRGIRRMYEEQVVGMVRGSAWNW